jgi:hypothetical protein
MGNLLRHSLLAAVLTSAIFSPLAPLARARHSLLELRQVSLAEGAPSHYGQLLRDTLAHELASASHASASDTRHYRIDARLSSLHSERTAPARSSCVVSLVITTEDSGSIFAVVQSKATAQEAAVEHAETRAIQAAARGALKRVSATLTPSVR